MKNTKRGYIYVEVNESVRVDTDDIIDEIPDDELMDELNRRKLVKHAEISESIPKEGIKLRKLLCDILEINYHSPDSNILDGIKERLT